MTKHIFPKSTNIEKVKETLSILAKLEPDIDKRFPFIIHHPFVNSRAGAIQNEATGEMRLVDVVDSWNEYLEQILKMIREAKSLEELFIFVNAPYLLTCFKYIEQWLNEKDYSNLLIHCYTTEEFPERDVNVSVKEQLTFFRKLNRELAMDEDELEYFNALPEEVTIYHGTKHKGKMGISWTTNLNVAKFFATRFGYEEGSIILQATVKKDDILAFTNCRNEYEAIINPKKIYNIKERACN